MLVDVAQGGVALRVEDGDLVVVGAAGQLSGEHPLEIDHQEVRRHLLDVAFNAGLRLVLDEHLAGAEHVRMQFGLTEAVAAYAVDVHVGVDHVRGEDGRLGHVSDHGGDDDGAAYGLGGGVGADDLQQRVLRQVANQLASGLRVHVIHRDFLDAQLVVERQRLELALRAIADQGHAAGVWAGEGTRGCAGALNLVCWAPGHRKCSRSAMPT